MHHRLKLSYDDFIKQDVQYEYIKERSLVILVVLQADDTDQMHRKFTRFLISAESENVNETSDAGTLDLQDDTLTKFADNCANAIVETSKVGKEEISVAWTSPSEGSGCVLIR